MEEGLNKRTNQEVPTNFLVKIMEIILKNNIFEFHEGYYIQNIGAAMGCKPIPPYANIFMAKIDWLLKTSKGAEALLLLKRFLDEYFFLIPPKNCMHYCEMEQITQYHKIYHDPYYPKKLTIER